MSRIAEIRETLSCLKASRDVTYVTGVQNLADDLQYLLDRLEAARAALTTVACRERQLHEGYCNRHKKGLLNKSLDDCNCWVALVCAALKEE